MNTASTQGIDIAIRPESESEYEIVNQLIYTSFSASYGIKIGEFMKCHFIEERKKESFVPELSLVALTSDGTIVGEIALWHISS